jgi:hypothetical protein
MVEQCHENPCGSGRDRRPFLAAPDDLLCSVEDDCGGRTGLPHMGGEALEEVVQAVSENRLMHGHHAS